MRSNYWIVFGCVLASVFVTGAWSRKPNTLTVDCPPPITLREGSAYDTTVTGLPKVTTNTGGKVTISYLEVYQKGDCKNRADLVTRIFTITNAAGEQVRCNQFITLQHMTINDIRIPSDTIIDHPDSLSTLTSKLLRIPKSLGSVRINYFDTRISQNCNIPVSIRRQWSIEDICNGQVRTGTTFMSVHKYFNSFKQIISKPDAVCEEEGFIQLSAVGEFAPYSYRWNTGDSLSFLSNIRAGSYTLTITDRFNCTASMVYDLLSMSQRADIGGVIRNEKAIRVTPDSIVFENENLIKKFCVSENAGLHYGFTLKTKTPGTYNFRMVKNSQARDAISTKDIVLIQRHILGLERFKDTAQNIAADVNFNFQITASDITEIRRIILGIKETFNVAKPWYFLRNDWRQVAKPNRPISDIEFKGVTVQNFPLTNVNVYALKMGDVDFSYTGFQGGPVERSQTSSKAYVVIGPKSNKGFPVFIRSHSPLFGLQCAFELPANHNIEIVPGLLKTDEYRLDQNKLFVSWTDPFANSHLADQPLFYLMGPSLRSLVLSDAIPAECYDEQFQTLPLDFLNETLVSEHTGLALSFHPNPVADYIQVWAPKGAIPYLDIMNMQGVITKRVQLNPGDWNRVDCQKLNPGLYFLRMTQNGLPDQTGKLLRFGN